MGQPAKIQVTFIISSRRHDATRTSDTGTCKHQLISTLTILKRFIHEINDWNFVARSLEVRREQTC